MNYRRWLAGLMSALLVCSLTSAAPTPQAFASAQDVLDGAILRPATDAAEFSGATDPLVPNGTTTDAPAAAPSDAVDTLSPADAPGDEFPSNSADAADPSDMETTGSDFVEDALPPDATALTDDEWRAMLQQALPEGADASEYYASADGETLVAPDTFTLLLIGTDNYGGEVGRSDAMIAVRVNKATGSVRMVSFLRDMYVQLSGRGMNRLNAAYVYGGGELLCRTLENNFGVHLDAYLAVNFSLMADLVDQLGGVTLDVSKQERTQLNSILKYYNREMGLSQKDGLLDASGLVTLSGKQAMCFARIRRIDDDFHRTERQRKVLAALLSKATTLGACELISLVSQNLGRVQTNLKLGDALTLVPLAFSLQTVSVEGMHVPIDGSYQDEVHNGMMVLAPNLKRNRRAIDAFWGDAEEP